MMGAHSEPTFFKQEPRKGLDDAGFSRNAFGLLRIGTYRRHRSGKTSSPPDCLLLPSIDKEGTMSANRSKQRVTRSTDIQATPSVVAAQAVFAQLLATVTTGCAGKQLHMVERLIWAQLLELGRLL